MVWGYYRIDTGSFCGAWEESNYNHSHVAIVHERLMHIESCEVFVKQTERKSVVLPSGQRTVVANGIAVWVWCRREVALSVVDVL